MQTPKELDYDRRHKPPNCELPHPTRLSLRAAGRMKGASGAVCSSKHCRRFQPQRHTDELRTDLALGHRSVADSGYVVERVLALVRRVTRGGLTRWLGRQLCVAQQLA